PTSFAHTRPPGDPTCRRNPKTRAGGGWERPHTHPSPPITVLSRRLPPFPIPCSRSIPPLLYGEDVRPAYDPSALPLAKRRTNASASSGTGTIEQTRGSPRSQASSVRSSNSASMPSDFARRIRRSTGTLEGWITYTSTVWLISHRASQKPDHPAS